MTEIEHLLVCLMEECAEVQQAASKCLRFGLDHKYPNTDISNTTQLDMELDDLSAVVEMIQNIGPFGHRFFSRIDAKKEKLSEYMNLSRKLGVLE